MNTILSVLHILSLFPPSLTDIRLGGFGLLDIFRIGYFGLVFDLAYQTFKNFCMYCKDEIPDHILRTIASPPPF